MAIWVDLWYDSRWHHLSRCARCTPRRRSARGEDVYARVTHLARTMVSRRTDISVSVVSVIQAMIAPDVIALIITALAVIAQSVIAELIDVFQGRCNNDNELLVLRNSLVGAEDGDDVIAKVLALLRGQLIAEPSLWNRVDG